MESWEYIVLCVYALLVLSALLVWCHVWFRDKRRYTARRGQAQAASEPMNAVLLEVAQSDAEAYRLARHIDAWLLLALAVPVCYGTWLTLPLLLGGVGLQERGGSARLPLRDGDPFGRLRPRGGLRLERRRCGRGRVLPLRAVADGARRARHEHPSVDEDERRLRDFVHPNANGRDGLRDLVHSKADGGDLDVWGDDTVL